MELSDNYESVFGSESVTEVQNFLPNILPMTLNNKLIEKVMEDAKKKKLWVLAFVIGTKPCFYKFYGSIVAANKLGIPNFVINSNQHYDGILTRGLTEFNIQDSVVSNLAIRGDLAQKSAELMIKISWIARHLKKKWPEVVVVPAVLGDTIMTSIVPAAWMFSRMEKAIQIEAGLRSMTPEVIKQYNKIDVEKFIEKQFDGNWNLLTNEPFPEQWDTYTSAAGSEYLFAPIELNKDHLIREGYSNKKIFVTGGVVVDALEVKRKEKVKKSIFEIYPQLEKGKWLRVDIHRRENLTPKRFKSIIQTIKTLVEKGYNLNFIEMGATKRALDFYGLRSTLDNLSKNKNFLHTQVWPEYANVIEFFESDNCIAAFTDSGGVQEELNLIGKPCLTCRLSTDRPETVKDAKSNILVPPGESDYMLKLVEHIVNNDNLLKQLSNGKKIYGSDVGNKVMTPLLDIMKKGGRPFKWAHEELGLWKEDTKSIEYL